MIDFYTARTPNGLKVHIMLEELGMKYELHMLDLKAMDQKQPDYLKINPNGRIPTIVDREGEYGRAIPVFESGAILNYLAEKSHHFIGSNGFEKAQTMGWLMFQMSGIGPNFGNYNYAKNNNIPQMLNRFEVESKRLLSVMNTQLAQNEYLAGGFYSIADIATYPWIAAYLKSKPEWFELNPHVRRWADLIGQRPAVKKVMNA
ncbi:glutathione S-transferase N-terminal domain-containing protein [Bdellovibrio sp. HCB337]|uniref:glutathione S-transferase N-terminal domain-containing protein n=1 Tax=Bdellovibrio sp. HCB337 TaxID=3394358 RepID=UPI0039A7215B